MPHPGVFWYRLNGMGTQINTPERVFTTPFPYIFHVKTKWNIVYKYLKTKTISRKTNILPQMHWISNILGHSATPFSGFWVSLNYPMHIFKKTVSPKNVWMWNCQKYFSKDFAVLWNVLGFSKISGMELKTSSAAWNLVNPFLKMRSQ